MDDASRVARASGALAISPEEEARLYALYHAPRYRTVLDLVTRHRPGPRSILDIGTSALTVLLHERFGVPVDTLGFEPDGASATGRHFHLDLNAVQREERPRTDLPRYDVVVFAEVLEHLPTSPRLVLGYLRGLLEPDGILVLQTPNAVHLVNRVKMVLGRNPYELINETPGNPGHFREYTAAELRAYAAATGFRLVSLDYGSYFDLRFAHHSAGVRRRPVKAAVRNWLNRTLPPSLRPGLTLVLRRADPA